MLKKKKKKNVFVVYFRKAYGPRSLMPYDLRSEFCAK